MAVNPRFLDLERNRFGHGGELSGLFELGVLRGGRLRRGAHLLPGGVGVAVKLAGEGAGVGEMLPRSSRKDGVSRRLRLSLRC